MKSLREHRQRALAALLCLSLVVWSVVPAATHAPTILETLQDHAEVIAEHGHSHGFEEDLLWAMHGHSHDVTDHDHSQIMLAFGERTDPYPIVRDSWRLRSDRLRTPQLFRIERPPRA